MSEIVLFPSVLGVRPAIRDTAARWEALGHTVHLIDLYGEGRRFETYDAGFAYVAEIGGPAELGARARKATADLPTDVSYVGFSLGGASAELLALTRPGARSVALVHASLPIGMFGAEAWPAGVPLEVHFAAHDPFRDQEAVDALATSVRAASGAYAFHEYPITGHLFTDPELPEYDAAASALVHERLDAFLA